MTETEWMTCDDPLAMYAYQRRHLTPRQRHLFARACGRRHCRHYWVLEFDFGPLDPTQRGFYPVRRHEVEQLSACILDAADEQCDGADRRRYIETLRSALTSLEPQHQFWRDLAAAVEGEVSHWLSPRWLGLPEERLFQADLFREIVGNPFCVRSGSPTWRTPDVLVLAESAYACPPSPEGRLDPDHAAALSDALEEAGCSDDVLLSHLREEEEHVRGCWAIDTVLGKR